MTTQFVGFKGNQLGQIQRANVAMASALSYSLDVAFNNNDMFLMALEKYFGRASRNQSAVMTILNSMILTVRGGTYDLILTEPDGSAYAQAFTRKPAKGGRIVEAGTGKKKQYHMPYVQTALDAAPGTATNARLNIEIMPAFFDLPYRGKDRDTQVETLIHEMSHHAANTNDEKVLGVTCYGLMGVKAARLAGKASNNAENYGYFVSSFQNFA